MGRRQRVLADALYRDGHGDVLALAGGHQRDDGIHGKLCAQQRVIGGVHVLDAALTADAGTTAIDSTRASVTAREQTLAMNVDEYFCIVLLLS